MTGGAFARPILLFVLSVLYVLFSRPTACNAIPTMVCCALTLSLTFSPGGLLDLSDFVEDMLQLAPEGVVSCVAGVSSVDLK